MSSTVLITGATQGIGKATALLFAQHGYNVILAARHVDRLHEVAQEIEALGHSALAVPTDVRNIEQVQHLIDTAIERYQTVEVLVNNAGIYISGPVDTFSLEDWHQAIDTNLWGYIHTIHELLPHLLKQGQGTIVNVSSIGGKVATPYLTPYTTSKFAITGLTQALQAELAPKGIQVCGIYPNLIRTSFLERAIFRGRDAQDAVDRREQIDQLLHNPVIETPEDVAKAIWHAIQHNRSETIVGSANVSVAANALFPGLLQRLARLVFKHKDAEAQAGDRESFSRSV